MSGCFGSHQSAMERPNMSHACVPPSCNDLLVRPPQSHAGLEGLTGGHWLPAHSRCAEMMQVHQDPFGIVDVGQDRGPHHCWCRIYQDVLPSKEMSGEYHDARE